MEVQILAVIVCGLGTLLSEQLSHLGSLLFCTFETQNIMIYFTLDCVTDLALLNCINRLEIAI